MRKLRLRKNIHNEETFYYSFPFDMKRPTLKGVEGISLKLAKGILNL